MKENLIIHPSCAYDFSDEWRRKRVYTSEPFVVFSLYEHVGNLKEQKQEQKEMNTSKFPNQVVLNAKVTMYKWQIHVTSQSMQHSNIRAMQEWQDTIEWWLEIIRRPERLLPKGPQIIYTTDSNIKPEPKYTKGVKTL